MKASKDIPFVARVYSERVVCYEWFYVLVTSSIKICQKDTVETIVLVPKLVSAHVLNVESDITSGIKQAVAVESRHA